MTSIRTLIRRARLTALAALSLAGAANAQNAGLRTLTVPGDIPMTVALFYPTAAPARAIPMGPWQPVVAPGAAVG